MFLTSAPTAVITGISSNDSSFAISEEKVTPPPAIISISGFAAQFWIKAKILSDRLVIDNSSTRRSSSKFSDRVEMVLMSWSDR